MAEKESMVIYELLADSLSLQANVSSPARVMNTQRFEDPVMKLFEKDPSEFLGLKKFGPKADVSESEIGTPIQEFFRGANVFVTGGTGFFGKVLTEKLIRSLPHVRQVYILIRPKRGKTVNERFEQLLDDKLFDRMKAEVPHYRSKVWPVAGDLAQPGLGLSAADRLRLTDVHVVFHSAADVRFVEPLKSSIISNVVGCQRVLALAKEMKNLKSFVHVSTAYSQCVLRKVPEAVPKLPVSYKDILHAVKNKSDEELERDIFKIMQGWPNTYTFTKAVCEDMVQEESQGMPICIFRPAVVGCTYREPVRGWTDNLYGPLGLFVGSALGAIHSFRLNQEHALDFVPVDYVINAMIAAAWRNGCIRGEASIPVYNFTSPDAVKRIWKVAINCGLNYRDHFPFQTAFYYTAFIRSDNYVVNELAHLFLHRLPGKLIDKVLQLCGKKPRLTKVYDRIGSITGALRFFTTRIWEFENTNLLKLGESMSEEDNVVFGFDLHDLCMLEYFFVCKLGIRYFYFKESMESLPAAQRKNTWLKGIHYTLKIMAGLVVLKSMIFIANVLPI